MPQSMVKSRRSIHETRDKETPSRQEFDEGLICNSSEDQITTESGTESEGFECSSRRGFERSRSIPNTSQSKRLKQLNASLKPCYTNESSKPSPKNPGKGFSFLNISLIVLAILVVYLGGPKLFSNAVKNCSFENLQKQYPQEYPKLWRSLKVGIESILNKRNQNQAVFLFIHHGGQRVFQLIKNIALHSSSCFGKKMQPIEMKSDDFITSPGVEEDYGYAIKRYKNKIRESNVILIANLNEIPAQAARALHAICDTHTPIANDVVILLTLTIPENITGKPVFLAENTLMELWGSKLSRNELDALITRVTDQVIDLQV